MLDLLIIVLYVLVALKILFKFFQWFQNRFNIFGKPQSSSEVTSTTEIHSESQTGQKITEVSKEPTKSIRVAEQSLVKKQKPEVQKGQISIIQKSESKAQESFISIDQKSSFISSDETSRDLYKYVISPEAQVKQNLNESILPPQIKNTSSWIRNEESVSDQVQNPNDSLLVSLKQECEMMRRQKESAIQKMLKYVQKVKEEKQLLVSNHQKIIEAILNEKLTLQNQIKQLQANHQQTKVKYQQTIAEMQAKFNEKTQELQTQLEQSQHALQEELINSKASQAKISHFQNQIASTVNETINGSINIDLNSIIQDPMTQSKIEELKSELQFCQSQLQQAYQSESKLKQEIEHLKVESLSKAKTQISITDVISHPEYLRIKDKLQKYENGTPLSYVRSAARTEFTPQGERLNKGVESRISQRRSFIPSRVQTENGEKGQSSEEIFGESNFLNSDSKHFLLDEIKRIKKLPIKKTKLIFKLDKLSPANPHEFIDNIPNIVLLIELTNKKVLAAFTQTAFSKEDIQNQSVSSVARSRLGSNKSLILDLTNKAVFPNTNPNETIIYDENAIVWGKDELIIKNDEPTLLYSSFGSQDGVYWDGKYTMEELLGGSQGFERINQYEFYRIYIG